MPETDRSIIGRSAMSQSVLDPPRRRVFSALELHAFLIGTAAAVILLGGWGFGITFLRSFGDQFPATQPVTAAGFMLLSVACLTSLRGSPGGEKVSLTLSLITMALVLGSLALPALDPLEPHWATRPQPTTLVVLSLSAAAMLLVVAAPRASMLIGALALGGITAGLFRLAAMFIFGGGIFELETGVPRGMSIAASVLGVWFMAVCVLMNPRLEFAAAVFQPGQRGKLLRRALPAMAVAPTLAGLAAFISARAFGWSPGLLFGLSTALTISFGVALIWWIGRMVQAWQQEANDQAARMAKANEALEQYASAAAHDLKAPARHILLYAELLEDAQKRGNAAEAARHAEAIRAAAAELPGVINGMLEYSRSAWSRLNIADHKLSELVGAASQLHAADIAAERASVTVAHDAVIPCDRILMTAVFQNLIANSLKNGRDGQPVKVKVDAARDGEMWRITVEDNGKGFAREHAAVAFNPLARSAHLGGKGTGIGLATCRTIVQSHGGDIRVDADYRDGARITFTIAAERPQAEAG